MNEQTKQNENKHASGQSPSNGGLERANLISRAIKLRDEIAQIFVDAGQWNHVHTPCQQAIDPDPDGALRRLYDNINLMLEKERSNVKVRG